MAGPNTPVQLPINQQVMGVQPMGAQPMGGQPTGAQPAQPYPNPFKPEPKGPSGQISVMEMTDRAKGLSDAQVKQAFRDGSILPYILLAEMNNRKAARDDAMASEASAQPSNVAEDLGLGLGGLGETAFLAEGGIVGYAPGGQVGDSEYEDFELDPTREPGRTLASLIVKYPDAPVDKLKAALIKHTGMEENVVRQAITQFHGYTSMRELTNAFPEDERSFLERSRENFTKGEFQTEEERKTADETWTRLFGGGVYTPEQAKKPIAPEGITNAIQVADEANVPGDIEDAINRRDIAFGRQPARYPDEQGDYTVEGGSLSTKVVQPTTNAPRLQAKDLAERYGGRLAKHVDEAGGRLAQHVDEEGGIYEMGKKALGYLTPTYSQIKRGVKGAADFAWDHTPRSTKRGIGNLYDFATSKEGRDRAAERGFNQPWMRDFKRNVGDPGAELLNEVSGGRIGDKVFEDVLPDSRTLDRFATQLFGDAGIAKRGQGKEGEKPADAKARRDRAFGRTETIVEGGPLADPNAVSTMVADRKGPIVPTDEDSSGIGEGLRAHKNQLARSKAAALAATPEKASGLQALLDPTTGSGAALLAGFRLIEEGGKGKDPLTAAGTAGKDVIEAAGKRQMATRKLNIEEKAMQAAALTAAARAKTAEAWTERNAHAALTLDVQSSLAMWKADSTSVATLYTALSKANSNDKPAFLKYIGDLDRRMEMLWNHMKGLGIGVKGPYQGMASNMGGGSGSSDGFTVTEAGAV